MAEFGEMANSELSDLVGARLREQRKRAGLSVEQLSERCTEHGLPLSPTAIYLIEGGGRGKAGSRSRRRITIEEWLVLSYMLGVSPLLLLLPEDDVEYPVTSELVTTAKAIYMWLIGERRPPLPRPDEGDNLPDDQRISSWVAFTERIPYAGEREMVDTSEFNEMRASADEKIDQVNELIKQLQDAGRLAKRVDQLEAHVRKSGPSKEGGEDGKSEDQDDSGR